MVDVSAYIGLTDGQVEQLILQGCVADDWGLVLVASGFEAGRVRDVEFVGKCFLGGFAGVVADVDGFEKKCGVYDATLISCSVSGVSRVSGVGVHVANYNIADDVCIENVGVLQVQDGAKFGCGVEVAVVNEGGGREVRLFEEINSQFAYIAVIRRGRGELVSVMEKLSVESAKVTQADRGEIGKGAKIRCVGVISDVKIGDAAVIDGAARLENGTILSEPSAKAVVGAGVVAKDFIIAEGASVLNGTDIERVYVGQGSELSNFSAVDSLFFANCQGYNGEACSVLCGPYTVTHHKATLLLAGVFSFYNAGSATNQSNHMYRLGPVHEGKLLRGCKTGSSSHMLWPSVVGPFSAVIGKHSGGFDVGDFPFSRVYSDGEGRSVLAPGILFASAGVMRDVCKWPRRDKRAGSLKRDAISFSFLNPYIAGKMMRAAERLKAIGETAGEMVCIDGVWIHINKLTAAVGIYRDAVKMYLLERMFSVLGEKGSVPGEIVGAEGCCDWVDIGGLILPMSRLAGLENAVVDGGIGSVAEFGAAVSSIAGCYEVDEWAWVASAWQGVFGSNVGDLTEEKLGGYAKQLIELKKLFVSRVIEDAEKEYSERFGYGFGVDGSEEDAEADFVSVRGSAESDGFIADLREKLEAEVLELGKYL